jgi:flagellar hook-length control protein FliK
MSADSLFSIVAPATAPATAPAVASANDESGFDRMLGAAMEDNADSVRRARADETSVWRAETATARSTAARTAANAPSTPLTVPVDDAVMAPIAVAVSTVTATTFSTPDTVDEQPSVLSEAAPAGDSDATPPAAAATGIEVAQILPPAPPVPVVAVTPPPPADPKTLDVAQVLPAVPGTEADRDRAAADKTADAPLVLPPTTGKDTGPQVLPATPATTANGKGAVPQVLPAEAAAAKVAGTADPAATNAASASTAASTASASAASAAATVASAAAAAAVAVAAPAVVVPPLRPPTDRSGTLSNSARGNDRAVDAVAVPAGTAPTAVPAPTPTAAAPTTPPASALSDRPLDPAAATPTPVVAGPDAPVEAPLDRPQQQQGGALPVPVAQVVVTPHDLSLSTLSRASVETTAQIAAQISRRLEGRSTRFEMALTPDDLGRVDVSLDIDENGRLAARLAFDNPAAALDMKGRVDELRRQLEEAGFHLADDAFQFTDRDRSSGEAFDRRQGRAFAAASRLSSETDAAAPLPAASWMSLSLTPDRVDMKV